MAFLSCRQCPQMDLQRQNQRNRCWWVWNGYGFSSRLHSFKYPLQRRIRTNSQIHLRKGEDPTPRGVGLFFCLLLGFLFSQVAEVQSCNGSQSDHFISVARIVPRKETHLEAKQFVAKSRKESQSDHFIFFATKIPLFDSQEPGAFPTIHAPRNLRLRSKRRGSQSVETQEIRRPNHLQTNIEPWLKGGEPRKKKHSYWLLSSNALISVIILP